MLVSWRITGACLAFLKLFCLYMSNISSRECVFLMLLSCFALSVRGTSAQYSNLFLARNWKKKNASHNFLHQAFNPRMELVYYNVNFVFFNDISKTAEAIVLMFRGPVWLVESDLFSIFIDREEITHRIVNAEEFKAFQPSKNSRHCPSMRASFFFYLFCTVKGRTEKERR